MAKHYVLMVEFQTSGDASAAKTMLRDMVKKMAKKKDTGSGTAFDGTVDIKWSFKDLYFVEWIAEELMSELATSRSRMTKNDPRRRIEWWNVSVSCRVSQ